MAQTTDRAFVRRCLEGLEKQVAICTRVYTTSTAPLVVDKTPSFASLHWTAQLRRLAGALFLLLTVMALWRILDQRRTRLITRRVEEVLEHHEHLSAGDLAPP
jgi:hypothetical protein